VARDELLRALDDCLARLRAGETVEQCLAAYPQFRAELEPLLRTAQQVAALPPERPAPGRRQALRHRIASRVFTPTERRVSWEKPRHSWAFRLMVPAAVVTVLAVIAVLAGPLLSPQLAYAGTFTLSVLKGDVQSQRAGDDAWQPAAGAVDLPAGSSVRTAGDGYAVLTFFDGSTTRLDPGTEVLVSESSFRRQQVRVSLEQPAGKTWSNVLSGGDQSSYFAIKTPQLLAVAQGTSFTTAVEPSGDTLVSVAAGQVEVTGAKETVQLTADQEVRLGLSARPVVTAAPTPPAKDELLITVPLAGIASVRDPSGAATGSLPNGLASNQITSAASTIPSSRQVILLKEPEAGDYTITVRCLSAEAFPVSLSLESGGLVTYQHMEMLAGDKGNGWLLHLRLVKNGDGKLSAKLVSVEPLAENSPETIVVTELAKKRAVAITSASQAAPTTGAAVNPNTSATRTPDTETTATKPAETKPLPTKTTGPDTGNKAPSTNDSKTTATTTVAPKETAATTTPATDTSLK